jgi:hypothetical protein
MQFCSFALCHHLACLRGHNVDHSPSSSTEVKERVELYHSPCVPSWHVTESTFCTQSDSTTRFNIQKLLFYNAAGVSCDSETELHLFSEEY